MNFDKLENTDRYNIYLRDYSQIDEKYEKICGKIQENIKKHNVIVLNKDGEDEQSTDKMKVFDKYQGKYYTKGYVGVIKSNIEEEIENEDGTKEKIKKEVSITIGSRFDEKNRYEFLNYIFSQVFDSSGKIFKDMTKIGSANSMWDTLLALIYIKQLEDSFNQGLFRKYVNFEYNDSKLKGKIDISRHIKLNPLENGKIAYSTREYTVKNDINKLILLANDCLKNKYGYYFDNLMKENKVAKDAISTLKSSIPSYNSGDKFSIIHKCSKSIYHPTYMKYEELRKTCIMIIRKLGLNIFESDSNEVYGILISMDQLWEKYLHKNIFMKLENIYYKNSNNGLYTQIKIPILYPEKNKEQCKMNIKPDFYIDNTREKEKNKRAVFDAKYKKGWGDVCQNDIGWSSHVRNDVYQVISYMGILDTKIGGVIFPINKSDGIYRTYESKNKEKVKKPKGAEVLTVSDVEAFNKQFYQIPIFIENKEFNTFEEEMKHKEDEVIKYLKEIL